MTCTLSSFTALDRLADDRMVTWGWEIGSGNNPCVANYQM